MKSLALPAAILLATGHGALAESEPAQVWRILEIAGMPAADEAFLALDADGNASGSTGCNRFQAAVSQSGAALAFGPVAATRMACPPGLAEQEDALLRLLGDELAVTYHLLRDQVTLTGADGTSLVMQREE